MASRNDEFSVLHTVFCDLILEQRTEHPSAVRLDLTLHDLHQTPLLVLQLFAERHNGVRLRHKSHQGFIAHIHSPLAQGYHPSVSGIAAHGMDRGHHRHTGAGRLLGRIRFRAAHLADHNNVRVKAERHIQKGNLIHTLAFIFAVTGKRMND